METVSVVLREARSYSVKLPGKSALKLVKGKEYVTDDSEQIAFFRSHGGIFGVNVLKAAEPARKAPMAAEPEEAVAEPAATRAAVASKQPRRRDARPKLGGDDE